MTIRIEGGSATSTEMIAIIESVDKAIANLTAVEIDYGCDKFNESLTEALLGIF
jgi:hypothetical protein